MMKANNQKRTRDDGSQEGEVKPTKVSVLYYASSFDNLKQIWEHPDSGDCDGVFKVFQFLLVLVFDLYL